ncbi:MAG: polyamine aminopropyltransferase [Arsenophonus sp. ER-BJ3-MAG3]
MSKKEIWLETLYDNLGQYFTIDNILYHNKTDYYQDLIIFENAKMGRIMAINNVVQTTERDEFIYHEMMVHVPLFTHGYTKKVLIIGGGDGGILREVCRHKYLESITMVEIDANVVKFCNQYLPNHNAGSYNDPRFKLIIDDGLNFIKSTKKKFDLIISDCTDPIGPGERLFTSDFYQGCVNCLNKNGILVAQNGVCFLQQNEIINSNKKLSFYFKDHSFYQATIPSYYGGIMIFAWASKTTKLRQISLKTLEKRFKKSDITCRYYTPELHLASFALPQYLLNLLAIKKV